MPIKNPPRTGQVGEDSIGQGSQPTRHIGVAPRCDSAAASHSWGGYHWARTSSTFTLKLGDNVSGAWDTMLRTASSDWSQSTVLDTRVLAGGTRPKSCRPT